MRLSVAHLNLYTDSISMVLKTDKNVKLYYSIKEVAQMFDVRESTLRYWETEFPHLKPKTVGQSVRQYTEKDIEQVRIIYNLIRTARGLTKVRTSLIPSSLCAMS